MTAVGTVTSHGSWLGTNLQYETSKPIRGAFHQTHGVEYYPSGFKHYFSPHRTDSDAILLATGETLSNIRRENDNDYASKVVAQIARVSDHFSRIDLSVDIFDRGRLAWNMFDNMKMGSKMFGRRGVRLVCGGDMKDGCTTYVGSRTSPKFLRIYDKNAETGGKIPATRIEFELKQDAAIAVSERLKTESGWLNVTGLFNHLLLQFADWEDYPVVEQLTLGEVVTMTIPERESMLSKKEWLSKQVMPTFVKEWDTGGSDLWTWFCDMVEHSHE
jgi:hypothetical protein